MIQIKHILTYLKNEQATIDNTVDELLYGDENEAVTHVATTFNASVEVIEQASQAGIQLIISHEGIYYTHRGIPNGLDEQLVYEQKQTLIKSNQVALYRYHDYMHRHYPDPITAALVEQIGWNTEQVEHQPHSAVVTLASESDVKTIANQLKEQLQLPYLRLTGELHTPVKRVGVLVGYRGGSANSITLMHEQQLDLLIVGEAQEWETAEYITDCNALGQQKAMLTIGHMASEAYGMQLLADRLKTNFPELQITFIKNKPCYQTI